MTGERVDLELQQMDATIFDEFIDTMECNLYCRCGAPNDAVQKMASAILALRAQVAALAVVTDEMVDMALSAYNDNVYRSVEKGMRAALATVLGVAATEQRCKTCRHARVDGADMECESMSRVQFMGPPPNGTAYATPYEGCSAVVEVSPEFGCVMWSAHKDGV